MPNIVYDNIIFSLQRAGGISAYWRELCDRINQCTFYGSKNNNIFRSSVIIKEKLESTLPINILRYLPFLKIMPKNSIFHSSYYRVSLQRNIANIITIHDFTYEYYRKGIPKWIHTKQKYFAIKNASGIICVSKNTKNDLIKFFPYLENKLIKVIYNGASENFFQIPNPLYMLTGSLEKLKNKKYILYVGDRSSYKNFKKAIEIIEAIENLYLVIVGGEDFRGNNNKIIPFQGIDNNLLNIIYNNAFCLFYPSSYEGFGIPILEAMKAGCPVVSTNFSSIPEITGDVALLVDRIDTDAFLEKIQMLEDSDFRSQLIAKGFKQAANFSWDKCFEETYAFYEEVYKRKFG